MGRIDLGRLMHDVKSLVSREPKTGYGPTFDQVVRSTKTRGRPGISIIGAEQTVRSGDYSEPKVESQNGAGSEQRQQEEEKIVQHRLRLRQIKEAADTSGKTNVFFVDKV